MIGAVASVLSVSTAQVVGPLSVRPAGSQDFSGMEIQLYVTSDYDVSNTAEVLIDSTVELLNEFVLSATAGGYEGPVVSSAARIFWPRDLF